MLGWFAALILPAIPLLSLPVSVIQFIELGVPDSLTPQSDGCSDASNAPWTHSRLGTFSRDPVISCPLGTFKYRVCCRPNQPKNINIKFIVDNGEEVVSTKDFRSNVLLNAIALYEKPVAWVVPGMLADDLVLSELTTLIKTFVNQGFNVMLVGWDEIDKNFGQSLSDSQVVAAMLGSMMLDSGTTDRSVCVGFSYGAHVCGMAGKFVKKEGKTIPRCHLLDPAGPGFELTLDHRTRLSSGDCDVMVSVHTTRATFTNHPMSLLHLSGFGTIERTAYDCSFEVNDGCALNQPGCFELQKLHFMIRRVNHRTYRQRGPPGQRCAHSRALSLYVSSLRKSCDLMGHDATSSMRFPPFDECEGGMHKTFKVNTTMAGDPYC